MAGAGGDLPPGPGEEEAAERQRDADETRDLGDPEGAHPEAVHADRFDQEAADGVEADVEVEDRARPIGEPPPRADQRDEHERVPERLVEEGRVEVLVPRVLEGAVLRGNVEPPGQVGGGTEGLLVEEVAPAPDGLADRDARRDDVERPPDRQPLPAGDPEAGEDAGDQAAVDREPTLPDRRDLPGVLAVVVPVEDDLVDPGAHESRDDRPLRGVEELVGGHALALGGAVGEPEADEDRGGHEDAVPPDRQRPEVERDRAGRPKHSHGVYTAASLTAGRHAC